MSLLPRSYIVALLLAPTLEAACHVLVTASCHNVLPRLFSSLSAEIATPIISIMEHRHNILRHFHQECGAACGTHHREDLTSRCRSNLLLLHLVDTAGLFIELAQILNIVGCQRENKAILAGIDDCSGLARNLLASHKVLDVLGNYNLHTIVLTDPLGKLEHKVQCNRELCIDKHVGLIDYNYNFPM